MKTLVKVILIMTLITSLSSNEVTHLSAIIPDFQVNENSLFSHANQNNPAISADDSGNFVITWEDQRNGGTDIYAQRYSGDGTAQESNFKVNDDQGGAKQERPSISADDSGNFVIVWIDERNSNWDIYAQRYSSDGTALGSNFKVNDAQGNESNRIFPSISVNSSGNFVIVWDDERNGDENGDIYAQRYANDGTALGSNFKVNDDQGSGSSWVLPSISSDDSGNFIITWGDRRNGDGDIYAQRYSSNGAIQGSNFQVNDDIDSANQARPSISADDSGNFIIVWQDARNNNSDIYAQRYSSDGTVLGSNFQANDDQGITMKWKRYPSISVDGNGFFIISWQDERNSSNNPDIYAQRYTSDGTTLGSNIKVTDDQAIAYEPSISVDDSGNFIITWQDERNGNADIYAQRYSGEGTALESNFMINDDQGSENQFRAAISVDDSDKFVITWQDERNGELDIFAQRYAGDGAELGSNFKVNDDQVSAEQYHPSISSDSNGNFIIAWWDGRNGPYDLYAQRYSSDGTAQGSNFRVNDDPGSAYQGIPAVTTDGSGNFIITWIDQRNGNDDIYAQRYSSEGTALESNFKVNDDQVSASQFYPSISADESGNFIITWNDGRNGFDNQDVYAQRYSSNGTALESNFKVNDDQGSTSQGAPSISTDESGNFIITWGDGRDGNDDIYAQRYSSDGTAQGSNFRVNDDQSSENQNSPAISVDDNGDFIITWHNYRDASRYIYAQRFFSDGEAFGSNFRVTNSGGERQGFPDVKLLNSRIYNTWHDNRAGGTGFDIWANVLDWDDPVGINDKIDTKILSTYKLSQNFPNPFNPSTTVEFDLPKSSDVRIEVYNIAGQKVQTLINAKMAAGSHQIEFNAQNLSSGVYFYKIEAGEFQDVKKMILLR